MAGDDMTARDHATAWRSIAPLVALLVIMLLFACGALFIIARETDRSDAARAAEAVQRTFDAMEARLTQAAQINGIDRSIARIVARYPASQPEVLSNFNFAWPDTIGYYGVIVLNDDGSPLLGMYAGVEWFGQDYRRAAQIARVVADRVPVGDLGAHTMLLRGAYGEATLFSAVNVLPRPGDPAPDLDQAPRRRLVMIQPVDKLLARMTPLIGAEDFRIVARGEGPNTLTLPTANGAPLVFQWKPRAPGRAAVLRWAPSMGLALMLAVLLIAMAMRTSLSATRAMQRLAGCDPLTGLPNRMQLMTMLDRRLAQGAAALVLLDLNGFKMVNDTYGHLAGDDLLRAFAAALVASAPPGTLVARLGGDEFACLGPDKAATDAFCTRLAERLEVPLHAGALRLPIAAGVGVAVARPEMTARDLMALADARLYRDKRARDGRGDGVMRIGRLHPAA